MNEEQQALQTISEDTDAEIKTEFDSEETDETETTEEATENDGLNADDEYEEEQQFYSLEQLENWNEDTDGEIDVSKLPPSIAKLINKPAVDELNSNINSVDTGLSIEEYEKINEFATGRVAEYLKSKGIEFDEYNDKHVSLIKNEAKNIANKVKERKVAEAKIFSVKESLERKYGEDFAKVDTIVSDYLLNTLSFNAYQKLLSDFTKGLNYKEVYKIYEEAYNKLNNKVKPKEATLKKQLFPPHSITGGKTKPKDKPKELTEHDFLARSNKW